MSSKLNDTFIFLSSIGFSLTSSQVLKEPFKDRIMIWRIVVHVAKWCRGLKQTVMLDRVNPKNAKHIDIKQHETSVRWNNELAFVLGIIRDLSLPITLTDLLKPQRDKMLMLIDKMRHYGLMRRAVQKAKHELFVQSRAIRDRKNQLIQANEQIQLEYVQEEAAREAQRPMVRALLEAEKEHKIAIEQTRQAKESNWVRTRELEFKREEFKVRLNNKRSVCESRSQILERLRAEYLKCLPNIDGQLATQRHAEHELIEKINADKEVKNMTVRQGQYCLNQLEAELAEAESEVEELISTFQQQKQIRQLINESAEKLNERRASVDMIAKQNEELSKTKDSHRQLLVQKELNIVGIRSRMATLNQSVIDLRARTAREFANSNRMKDTKRIVVEQESRNSNEIDEVRRTFQQRYDKLCIRVADYTVLTTSMLQDIYKEVHTSMQSRNK